MTEPFPPKASPHTTSHSPGLDALLNYPLVQAINERRTRPLRVDVRSLPASCHTAALTQPIR